VKFPFEKLHDTDAQVVPQSARHHAECGRTLAFPRAGEHQQDTLRSLRVGDAPIDDRLLALHAGAIRCVGRERAFCVVRCVAHDVTSPSLRWTHADRGERQAVPRREPPPPARTYDIIVRRYSGIVVNEACDELIPVRLWIASAQPVETTIREKHPRGECSEQSCAGQQYSRHCRSEAAFEQRPASQRLT